MAARCVIPNCKQVANAVCLCCEKKVCCVHFEEHQNLINEQSYQLIDRYNYVRNRITDMNANDLTQSARERLNQWRNDYYKKIDEIFNEKCKELERRAEEKINKLKTNTAELRQKLLPMTEHRQANHETITSETSKIEFLEKILDNMNHRAFNIRTQPIRIDHCCIDIDEFTDYNLKLLVLDSPSTKQKRPNGSYAPVASNDQFLLFHLKPDLYLVNKELVNVKKVKWKHEKILGMCWSTTSKQFLIVTDQKIFSVSEQLNSIKQIQFVDNRKLYSCTCSNKSLFVLQYGYNSSIVEYSMPSSSIQFVQEWKSPHTCKNQEWINDINCRGNSMLLVIKNMNDKTCRIELKNTENFNLLWQIQLDIQTLGNNPFACCQDIENGWFVLDTDNNQFFYITADGIMGARQQYNQTLWCATMFGNDILAITTDTSINFHRY